MTKLDFDTFRKRGPWHKQGDVVRAWARWKASVTCEDDLRAIHAAKEAYGIHVAAMMRLKAAKGLTPAEIQHYIMHFSTFMGRWQDWVEERSEALEDEVEPPLLKSIPHAHSHWCNRCPSAHAWECGDRECFYPGFSNCGKGAVRAAPEGVKAV